jgi:phosphoribosyl 1,2-cyclic phosphate phosphodiesterase
MQCTLLGTGTSHGIPVIGCGCEVCRSADPHDKRLRASAFIRSGTATPAEPADPATPGKSAGESLPAKSAALAGAPKPGYSAEPADPTTPADPQRSAPRSVSVLIDAGPEFRIQAIANNITAIDAVLITHSHADHIHGIDDLRAFSSSRTAASRESLPLYTNAGTVSDIRSRFSYMFTPELEGGGKPNISLHTCEQFTPESPLVIGNLNIVHIPMSHGSIATAGWLITETLPPATPQSPARTTRSIAYLTDCNALSDASIDTIRRFAGTPEHVILDGLRENPHSTHFCFDEALTCALKIGAAHTWITHICHSMSHLRITRYIEERNSGRRTNPVKPAYDGLILEI